MVQYTTIYNTNIRDLLLYNVARIGYCVGRRTLSHLDEYVTTVHMAREFNDNCLAVSKLYY